MCKIAAAFTSDAESTGDTVVETERIVSIDKPRKWAVFDRAFIILVIAVTVSLVFLVKVARENAQLKARLSRTSGTLAGPQSAQVGDIVPSFKTIDLTERSAEIAFDGSARFLIFIFSSGCGSCAAELPTWNRIAADALARGYTVRGISLDTLEQSRTNLADKSLTFDVLIMPDMPTLRAYRVVSIPEVLLVSGAGTIEWVYNGVMSSETVDEVLTRVRAGP